MELKWLEDFVALAALRNFSRTAEARAVTQPAFSRRIRTLEEWIGAALFERSPQGVTLTPAGEELLRGADDLIRRIQQVRRQVREAGGREAAGLRFAATHALSFTFFPRWMREFDPGARTGAVRLISDSMQACEELMLHGQAQFLLCHYHPLAPGRCAEPQFRSVAVGRDALVPCVIAEADGSPRWYLDSARGELPMLSYSAESGLGRILEAKRFHEAQPALTTVFAAHLAAALQGLARDGRGVAWLPATLAADDLATGRLVPAGSEDWEIPLEIRVFRPAAAQRATAELFWEALHSTPIPTS